MPKYAPFLKRRNAFCVIIFFVLGILNSNAQDDTLISGTYDNVPLAYIITDIESKSGYQFFFVDDWLPKDSVTVSFSNESFENVLDKLLSKTLLNYYVLESDKRVFLLENTLIYDELPRDFFGKENDSIQIAVGQRSSTTPKPVFFDDEIRQKGKSFRVVRIGKANENNSKSSYTLSGKAINTSTSEPIPDMAIRVADTNLITATDVKEIILLNYLQVITLFLLVQWVLKTLEEK